MPITDIGVHDSERLKELQALPLDRKIAITQARIIEWYNFWEGDVYVSFSGGKDSTVLLDLVIKTIKAIDPTFEVSVVFSNTGLEYPEIQRFAKSKGATFVTPKMNIVEVIRNYGYPLISKEVSSAIYYARRIKPYTSEGGAELQVHNAQAARTSWNQIRQVSAEVTRKQRSSDWNCKANDLRTGTSGGGKTSSEPLSESGTNCLTKESTHVVQKDIRRKELMGTMGSSDCSTKSKFNKKKWLPLAQELPALISHKCCDVMKKSPIGIYQRATHNKPYLGTMAEESIMRRQAWIRTGCNAFEGRKPSSQPLSFWTEQDILEYIRTYQIEICSVYGDIVEENGVLITTGCSRSGCIFCPLGANYEKGITRFQRLAETHPKQYKFCIEGGEWIDNPYYDPNAPEYDGKWKNWNPQKVFTANKYGLGMGVIFDMVNEIYGKELIRYKV